MWHHTTWLLLTVLVIFPVLYTYLLYPLLLELWHVLGKKAITTAPAKDWPEVHIVMAVYNEEVVLPDKLASIATLDYPAEKLHVWIGSDASSDATDDILSVWSAGRINTHNVRFNARRGKASVVNHLAEEVSKLAGKDAIMLLTDADILFSPSLLRRLIPRFHEDKVGLVDSVIVAREKQSGDHESTYWKWENRIKWLEGSLFGSTMGASGACYAIRASLFRQVPDNFLVDDFFLSMQVLQQGYAAVVEDSARCVQYGSASPVEEFRRKRRIAAGNWQNFRYYRKYFVRRFFPVGFCFYSHKFLRWLTPVFLAATWLILLGWSILGPGCPWWLLVILILSLATPLAALMLKTVPLPGKWLWGWVYFSWMQLAMALGTLDYLKGIHSNVWEPTKRVN